jgi:hypothetical protein
MAESKGTGKSAKAKPAEPSLSEYVILEAIKAEDWRLTTGDEVGTAWIRARHLGQDGEELDEPLRTFFAINKDKAIEAAVGDRQGTFKAVAASSWRGGRVKAQTTLIDSKPLND